MKRKAWIGRLAASGVFLALFGCSEDNSTTPDRTPALSASSSEIHALAAEVRLLTAGRGITALPKPPQVRPALVSLGQALAFDKVLSGNHDISCMTCHLPILATGDGRSLSAGQGGTGLGPARLLPPGVAFIPRNSPQIFNLFAVKSFFWDGRVSQDELGNFHTPAGTALTTEMTRVFEFGAASAQPLFPVLSREEMRAFGGNELADLSDDPKSIWEALMARLGAIPEYRRLFEAAYPGQRFGQMTFAHASNAMAGFFIARLSFNNSPWDRFLAGNDAAMTLIQLQGAKDFMSARCSICHNGPALTDNQFHNVAVAQIGPGKGDGVEGRDDFGRMRETGVATDKYAFRTPALRNVELTAPYGHDGAFFSLRDFVDHYSESATKLMNFNVAQLEPALQGTVVANQADILATRDPLLTGVVFPDHVVDEVTEFMKALTDPAARNLQGVVPGRVPSGLPVDGGRRP